MRRRLSRRWTAFGVALEALAGRRGCHGRRYSYSDSATAYAMPGKLLVPSWVPRPLMLGPGLYP